LRYTRTIMDKPYIPISCEVHDELLAFATLRQECEITVVLSEGRVEPIRGIIVDVYSRDGAEYLQLRDGSTFRLDQIQALNGKPIPPA
jgi:Rho-binding antiterminator